MQREVRVKLFLQIEWTDENLRLHVMVGFYHAWHLRRCLDNQQRGFQITRGRRKWGGGLSKRVMMSVWWVLISDIIRVYINFVKKKYIVGYNE